MNAISVSMPLAGPRALRATALFLALLGSAWLVQPLYAQSVAQAAAPAKGALTSELVATRIAVREDGREVQEPAQSVKPGEVIQYTATFKNTSKGALKQVAATLPIPRGTVLVAGTVKPEGAMASVDDVRFEPMPLKRKVQQPDGRWAEVAIPLSEYRSLRWTLNAIEPSRSLAVTARVQVDSAGSVVVASAPKR